MEKCSDGTSKGADEFILSKRMTFTRCKINKHVSPIRTSYLHRSNVKEWRYVNYELESATAPDFTLSSSIIALM